MFLIWVLFVLNPFANPYLLWFQFCSEMAQSYFPLRWESTGDQWWYVSPIDWAAANGHYDLVRELLYLDTNLLIKLTSLRRLRRLETVWDDDSRFENAAKCRSLVARNLLLECETKNHKNTLLRAGYGGWLLYTAASAGDVAFVKELLGREPLLVFGEGEYGVTDIFYAAARSKNSEVFRIVFEYASKPKGLVEGEREENVAIFRWEMANRAVHAAARGGNLEMMQEILSGDSSDVLNYRDVQGSTILHAASGRGQVEVVKYILTAFDIINSRDNEGNIALHIAAYRGHLSVVKTILFTCPSSSSLTNNAGDTFLHMAVAGFRTPGFHRLDSQMELMRQLVNGTIINIQEIINIRNDAGRTALHVAMIGNMHANLVEILMTARSINLNIRDVNGMTPLDLLGQRPRSASSEILIKQLVSAGGIFSSRDPSSISAIASQLKMQAIGSSPGTNFKISDAEIFLHAGIEVSEPSGRPSSCSSSAKSEIAHFGGTSSVRKQNYANRAANKLKVLLRWPRRKEKKLGDDDDSMGSLKKWSEREETPTPLRQRYSKSTSLLNHKRTLAVRSSMPSPVTKKKFTAGLMHGVIQAMPHLAPPPPSEPSGPSSSFDMFSRSGLSTPMSFEKQEFMGIEEEVPQASCSSTVVNGSPRKSKGVNNNNRAMNQYFCFGAQGLLVKDSVTGRRSGRLFKRSALRVA